MAWYVRSWFLVPASDLSEFVPILQGLRIDVEGVLIRLSGSRVCVGSTDRPERQRQWLVDHAS